MSKDEEVFNYILLFKMENDGIAPSLREICDNTSVKSTSHVNKILKKLERKGKINRIEGTALSRNIKVVGGEWIFWQREVTKVKK